MKKPRSIVFILIFVLPFSVVYSQNTGQALPGWFSKPENYNRTNLAVGISDPNPDTAMAIHEAKINALINYSILHDGKFTALTNVGMGTQQEDVKQPASLEYIIYTSIIKGNLPSLSSITIKDKFFTTFKEAVVLVEINNDLPIDSILAQYTIIRRAGFQRESNTLPLFADELDIEVIMNDSILLSTSIVKDRSRFTNEKKILNNKSYNLYNNNRMFYYQGISNEGQKSASMPAPLNYGLWKAYIFNLIDQISVYNSLDINCQYKLSTTNLGNINKSDQSLNFQQLVYSLKNVQAQKLNSSLKSININTNNLLLEIKSNVADNTTLPTINPNKTEKKQIKKLLSEKWIYLGVSGFETAWLQAMNIRSAKDTYLSTEIEIQATNLQSGIIEGIQLGKLQLSSQLATKVNALGKVDLNADNQMTIKSAKLINVEKTGNIGPYFIFYQNPSQNVYNIKMVLLYDLKQISDL